MVDSSMLIIIIQKYMFNIRYKLNINYSYSVDPFEEFFGARFHFQDQDITLFHKLAVTTR